jgi:hypothetical protein
LQEATEGLEKAVYSRLLSPFARDLPNEEAEGFERVCTQHNYAYIGSQLFVKKYSANFSCEMVKLSGTSFPESLTYIISKNNTYKGIINWK